MSDYITISGNLGADPEFSNRGGTPVLHFNVGSTERRFDRSAQAWVDGHTNWHHVVAFRGLAQNGFASLKKGQPVLVYGKLRKRSINKGTAENPEWATYVDLEAEHIGHDLALGRTEFKKFIRGEEVRQGTQAPTQTEQRTDGFGGELEPTPEFETAREPDAAGEDSAGNEPYGAPMALSA